MRTTLTLAAAALLGGLVLGAGSASAAPLAVNGLQAAQPGLIQVRMTRGERMMMKRRMMRERMMRKRMMRKRMMKRM